MNTNGREIFDGFPYLVTKIAGALHHLIVLPKRREAELERLAWLQALTNWLPTCLVLAPDRALYLDRGRVEWAATAPWCAFSVCERLRGVEVADDPELVRRRARLRDFCVARRGTGYLVEGARGRSPTAIDRERLSRRTSGDVPAGLAACEECGGQRGVALLARPDLVVDVFCFCDADNRCARCGQLLYQRRPGTCSYFADERQVLHVPAFSAFKHECPPDSGLAHADRAAVVEGRYSDVLKAAERGRPGWLPNVLAALQAAHPRVAWMYAETRGLAEDWAYRWLAACARADAEPYARPLLDERAIAEPELREAGPRPRLLDAAARRRTLLEEARAGTAWTSRAAAGRCRVSQVTAASDLAALVREGKLRVEGRGRARRYVAAEG